MKRPRIEDIDATATIDPTWANMPRIQKPPRGGSNGSALGAIHELASPMPSVPYAPYGSTSRRVMKRHPFEIYQDQLDELRRLADLDKRRGGTGSMSEMVRGVLDRFIAEKNKEGD